MKALEPVPQAVDAAAYKRSVHILPEDVLDDLLIQDYLREAQAVVETAARRPMTPRTVRFQARLVGASRWWLPVCPVNSIASVTYTDADGDQVSMALTDVRLEMPDDEPQLVFAASVWNNVPDDAVVTITANVGHAAGTAPDQLSRAVILIAKDWYDAMVAIDKTEYTAVSFGCKALIRQVRYAPPAQMIGEIA